MNHIKKLEQAALIFQKIQILDAEIIEIDKFAILASDYPTECSVELKMKPNTKEGKEKVLDSDGSLIIPREVGNSYDSFGDYRSLFSFMPSMLGQASTQPSNLTTLNKSVSDSILLGICGVLIAEKRGQRAEYIQELKELGFHL